MGEIRLVDAMSISSEYMREKEGSLNYFWVCHQAACL